MPQIQVGPLGPSDGAASIEILMDGFIDDPWAHWCFDFLGVAYFMGPDPELPTSGGQALLPALREACGAASLDRFTRYNRATEDLSPTSAHCIALIAVLAKSRGEGVGSALVRRVIDDAEADSASDGIVLDTGNSRNLTFYDHHGFEAVGHVTFEELCVRVLFRACEKGTTG